MPYITEENRDEFAKGMQELENDTLEMEKPGELNYVLSNIILDYVLRKGLCYDTVNEVMGVISCIQQEFYRRVVAPYENKKIAENGDLPQFRKLIDKIGS